jgi:hypothetical protein
MNNMFWKKFIILIPLLSMTILGQRSEIKPYGGITIPIGAELGFLGETDLPKIDMLKMFTKGSMTWAPVFGSNETTQSVLIGGLQPGLRLKILNDILLISGGLSVNPIAPLPFDGLDLGFGTFLGIGFRVKNVELGIYSTNVFGKKIFISEIGWISFTITKAFPVTKRKEKERN